MAISKKQIMKVKHIIASLFLSSFAAVGLAAGLRGQKVEQVKADAEPTWMVSATFFGETPDSWEGYDTVTGYKVHLWGTNLDIIADMHPTGRDHYYTASVALRNDQTVTGGQYILTQHSEDKYCDDLTFSFEKNTYTNGAVYAAYNEWPGGSSHWKAFLLDTGEDKYGYFAGGSQTYFEQDVANRRYVKRNMSLKAGDQVELRVGGRKNDSNFTGPSLRNGSKKYFSAIVDNGLTVKEDGIYDFYVHNSYEDGGILEVRKQESEDSYIYYVSSSEEATPNYIYAFSELEKAEQFGAFPGTSIASLVTSEHAKDVTGVVAFQGSYKKIYKIDVTIAHPGDDHIIFSYQGEPKTQSSNMLLVPGSAYWWSGSEPKDYHNDNAGLALDFILKVEAARNAVVAAGNIKAYSICGIDAATSKNLYNEYAAIDEEIRTTYIDCTKVQTYKQDKTEGEEQVLFSDIMLQLAKQGGIELSSVHLNNAANKAHSGLIIIIVASTVLAISGGLFFLKRKKD